MKSYLATIQVVLSVKDDVVPEEVLIEIADQAELIWRFYPNAPNNGFFMLYDYDAENLFTEAPQ